jgi:heme-degrading monooxygenase HmoA
MAGREGRCTMAEVWSSGLWRVKPGRETEFVEQWQAFASWTAQLFPGAHAWLLRDREQPNEFVSVGPWPSDDAIAEWRSDPGFVQRIGAIRQLLESFEPRTLDRVASAGLVDAA